MDLLGQRPRSTPVSGGMSTATGEHPLSLLGGIAVEIELLRQCSGPTPVSKGIGMPAATSVVSIILLYDNAVQMRSWRADSSTLIYKGVGMPTAAAEFSTPQCCCCRGT